MSASAPTTEPIPYSIAGCSEHSGHYVAENILVDRPQDQSSRWSGAQQPPSMKQWILLRLETLAIAKSITFGKFQRKHPCNMKEFKIYAGLNPDHMIQILHAGLRDDAVQETFSIPHINRDGVPFPTRFVKIVPLSAHGQSFHISIWYVSVAGITEPSYVERIRVRYDEHRETVVLRQILKHLRERRLLTPYQSILARSQIQFEHPVVTSLHAALVLQGNWDEAETLLTQASSAGLFQSYLQSCQPHAQWRRLHGVDADGDAPTERGGHAMCIDSDNGHIYLFGGWDGYKSLEDFWVYDIQTERWRVISHNTANEKNGPIARSCHKMVFDTKSGSIYLLGRLGDGDVMPARPEDEEALRRAGERVGSRPTAYCSEFYRYHTRGLDAGKWDLLSFDTASSGGPPLIFDHQMVMDCDAQVLYVSGGRVVDGDWDSPKYSGLYSYSVRTSKWKLLQPVQSPSSPTPQSPPLPRFGHSMVLDPLTHTLFIFAGQHDDKYLSDMYAYDIATNTVSELFGNFSVSGGPDACFTQRAVVDPRLKEVYVFCGLTRAQQSSALTVLRSDAPNWVYRYTNPSQPGKWTQILPEVVSDSENGGDGARENGHGNGSERGKDRGQSEPYAHQVVYDELTKKVYMHGGNAGEGRGLGSEEKENEEAEGRGCTGTRGGDTEGAGEDGAGNGNWTEGGASGEEDRSRSGLRETRLDDFWAMNLVRAAPDEVIRQAKYLIRRQRFREMCEEQPAVKALRYLQTDVSDVVDHTDPEETSVFRSLLAHLLSPSAMLSKSVGGVEASVPGPGSSESKSMDVDEREEPEREPPKKRSRSNTPDDSEVWTDVIDGEDEDVLAASHAPTCESTHTYTPTRPPTQACEPVPHAWTPGKRGRAVLSMDEDPLEARMRAEADGTGRTTVQAPGSVSAERFSQRTEVFERLLEFVGEEGKQPKGSLLDLVDAEDGL
ncbi:Muskelin N-terminus-domain-containing protein [Boletus edulis]|nr:Muskelin N-terminus-domain-containing protein [Boletus edulis]